MSTKAKIFIIAFLFSTAVAMPAFRSAQAFAPGVPNSIDWNDFFTHLLQSVEYEALSQATRAFITPMINKVTSLRGIQKYDTYLKNVANQVYVTSTISNQSVRDAYLTRSLINDSMGFTGTHSDLSPLYTQAALDSCNMYNVNKVQPGPDTYLFLANCPAKLDSTVAMQKVMSQDKSLLASSQAQSVASLDISQGGGSKSVYNCQTLTSATADQPTSSGQVTAARIDCITQNPAGSATNYLNSLYADTLGYEAKPQDNEDAAARAIAKVSTNLLFNKFINPSIGKLFGTAVTPFALGQAPLPGPGGSNGGPSGTGQPAAPFSLTQFQAATDSGNNSGNWIAGYDPKNSTNYASVPDGTTIIFEWDASALKPKGADHIIFSNGDHSLDSSRNLSGFTRVTASGNLTYTVSVIDTAGNTMVSDSIRIQAGSD